MHFRWNYFLIPINGKDVKPSRSCSRMLEAQWHLIRMINAVDEKNHKQPPFGCFKETLYMMFRKLPVPQLVKPSTVIIWFFGIIGSNGLQKVQAISPSLEDVQDRPNNDWFINTSARGLAMPIRSSLRGCKWLQLVIFQTGCFWIDVLHAVYKKDLHHKEVSSCFKKSGFDGLNL